MPRETSHDSLESRRIGATNSEGSPAAPLSTDLAYRSVLVELSRSEPTKHNFENRKSLEGTLTTTGGPSS
jgi:hypothetical protein